MSNNLSARHYQEYKEILQEKLMKDIKIFLQNKKKKSVTMVVNVTKISQKMKKINWLKKKKSYKIRKNCFL